jgi:hypothetical protein
MDRRRSLIFALLLVGCVVAGGGYVAWAALRGDSERGSVAGAADLEGPHVVFQNVAGQPGGNRYAHVALARLESPSERKMTPLVCERVYFAAERGLCLVPDHGPFKTAYSAKITGPDLEPRHEVELTGIPSRARISPDGRYGATTAFVSGHSYADSTFSTQTLLIDMERGEELANLEKDFTVTRNGKRIEKEDFNFWGVTFARKSDRFYATLRTGDKTYLLEGDVRARRARVLRENVECPSISPDNTRLAYKKRVGGGWRLHVLTLDTMSDTALAETRSIDDQVEWLDDDRVLYGFSPDIWTVPADGSGSPRKFLSKALSPAVVRDRTRTD